MSKKSSPLYAAALFSFALFVALGFLDVSNLSHGRGLTAQVISALSREKNPYSITSSKVVPGVFTFNYQYAKVKPKKGKANFDLPIVPFDEVVARKALGAATDFGRHRDAWGYPVHENAYQKIALGKSPKERTMLEPKTAYAADPGSLPGLVNCRANTSVTGYFEAYFEDVALDTNVGYDDPNKGLARRTAACLALQDVATILKLETTTITPDILFTVNQSGIPANALAAASSYNTNSGIFENGTLHSHIINHQDPTPGVGNFDAFIITNFGPSVAWDVDTNLNINTYNFQTVITHELLHALGFRSLLPATITVTNVSNQHGTFDEGLYKDDTPSATDRFFNAITKFLQVPVGAPSAWFISNINVYQGIKNSIGATLDGIRPVYSPLSWEQGSSLSHFDMSRSGGKVYIMNPSIGTNTIRTIHSDEKEFLCHAGYMVQGMNGCESATPVAKSDNASMISTTSQTPVATCISMLTNDTSFDGGILSVNSIQAVTTQIGDVVLYYTQTDCLGTQSSTPSVNTHSIKIIPTTSTNSRVFRYTVSDSVSNRISLPASIIFSAAQCASAPDEYVCNGGFEDPFNAGVWSSGISGPVPSAPGLSVFGCIATWINNQVPIPTVSELGSLCYVPFWKQDDYTNFGTPDIFSKLFDGSNSNFPLYYWYMLPQGTLTVPQGGNSIVRVLRNKGILLGNYENYIESVLTRLKDPLIPGQTYQVSFDAAMQSNTDMYSNAQPSDFQACIDLDTQMGGSQYQETSTASYYNFCQALTPPGPDQYGIDIPAAYTYPFGLWTHVNFTFIPTQPYVFMRAYGDLQYPGTAGMGYLSVVMDNFSIKPVYTNSVSGTVYYDQNVNGSLDTNELGLNGVQVKLFSQGSTIALQTVTTQNVPHLGEYSFANIPDGTYTVALVGENLYSQITEPVTNNPTLISGYTHAKQVTVSAGQTISNKNFGVVLVSDLCSNISGVQSTPPSGFIQVGSQCDACANMSGIQSSVPTGYTNSNGQCIKNATDTATVTDVCPNISGVQTTVPSGYSLVKGQCLKIMKSSTIPTTDISKSILDPFKTVIDPIIQSATR
jgi:hypothetical protein